MHGAEAVHSAPSYLTEEKAASICGLCFDTRRPGCHVNAIGGISRKTPFVMQTLPDMLEIPICIVRPEQTCTLGTTIFTAVAAGV